MMTLFLTYELKVAVLIAVFYIFWRLLVANETWHRLNRIVLLSTAVASFLLPLCVITIHQTVLVEGGGWTIEGDIPGAGVSPSTFNLPASETGQPFNWQLLLTLIYIVGVIAVLSKMLLSLWRLHRMTAESEIHPLADGRRIAVSEKAKSPFSWWKTVFLNHQDFEEGATALLTHELGHLRLHHSADVVLVELLTALQWFNPAMWMLRADLRTIHEYEADQQVLSHGFNDIQYLQLLIRKAAGQSGYSLANGISNSTLKNRVTMIMKIKSNRNSMWKLLALVPIVGVTLALNAETVTDVVYKNDEPQKQVPVKKGKKNTTVKTGGNQTIHVVEQDKTATTETPEPAKDDVTTVKQQEELLLPDSFPKKDKDLISEMSESTSFRDLTKRLPGAVIDEDGRITINGKAVKRIVFDGSDNPLALAVANIILNDAEYFDYEIDGVPISVEELKDKKSPLNPIKSIEYVQRDSEHPKDRLLITTKEAE